MRYFDTHAHYDDNQFNEDREETLEKIQKSGVDKCINIGCDLETSKKSIELSKRYNFIYVACGIHPSEIQETKSEIEKEIEKIKKLVLENNKVVAIGEIGLDYHYDGYSKELQQYAFIKQIELANELKLPISIHTRDAIDDTIAIIRNNKIENGGILHCCPFNKELVKHGLEQGLHIAFGGTSTFKNSKNAAEIINMVPNEKILTETDSPYLAPEPIRGTRNDSSNLKYIVQKIAEIKKLDEQYISEKVYKNACELFGISYTVYQE